MNIFILSPLGPNNGVRSPDLWCCSWCDNLRFLLVICGQFLCEVVSLYGRDTTSHLCRLRCNRYQDIWCKLGFGSKFLLLWALLFESTLLIGLCTLNHFARFSLVSTCASTVRRCTLEIVYELLTIRTISLKLSLNFFLLYDKEGVRSIPMRNVCVQWVEAMNVPGVFLLSLVFLKACWFVDMFEFFVVYLR